MKCKTLFRLACALLFFVLSTKLGYSQQSDLLKAYPCGPDSITGPLRKLIPQGAFGADFRPACVAHDACYDTPYSNRSQCDKQYLQNMYKACEQSNHPVLCRMTARSMARVTSRLGEKSFQSAQKIAIGKL